MSPQLADKLVMALDFGETNSSVSYTFIPEGVQRQDLPQFQPRTVLNNFSRMMNCRDNSTHLQIPTLLRYPTDWVFRPLDELKDEPLGTIRPDHDRIHWGLQVQQDMSRVMSHSDPDQMLLHGFKSLMTKSTHHQAQNKRLKKSLRQLSQKRTCAENIPIQEMLLLVVIDYLTKLLSHAKHYIATSNAISTTEMVICVPVLWKQKTLRDMQTCVNIAMRRVNFPGVRFSGGWMENVFMISEPEAAATTLLSSPSFIKEGDVFTILDAGGATCDAVTYIATQMVPLRLSRQAVPHGGDSCGSKALNDAFQDLLRDLLVDHEYLNEGGATLEGHICKLAVHDFEHFIKPKWFATEEKNKDQMFEIMGLKFDAGDPDQAGNPRLWRPNRLTIRSGDLDGIYKKVCESVSAIMKQQLHAAAQSGLEGQDIPPLFEKSARRIQTFPYWNNNGTVNHGPFICQEEIWVSDKAHLDYHSYLHEHNNGAKVIDILETDVTHLRHHFERKIDESQGQDNNDSRCWYWEFPYELVLTIDGLNMKYTDHE
ncbi:Hsp70 chaperone protein [Fusarium mundagurra]|uniref:Hsp70 chaperone protein n=1 Tax=Fusarium mundagurra TaxID=1567541 RepID=A0A8H6D697_9HYPO|nr:Hsp70 chaperone protein [Fusarium mundagurra]